MLDSFVHIREKLSIISLSESEIIGTFELEEEDLDPLKSISGKCADEFITVNGANITIDKAPLNGQIEVRLYPQRLTDGYFFEDENILVKRFSQSAPKQRYYIHSLEYWSDRETTLPFVVNYQSTLQLIDLLKSLADYQKETPLYSELVFFQTKKLVLTTEYKAEDIHPIEVIGSLQSQFTNTHDKRERQTIFVNELINSLIEVQEVKDRFKYLIAKFPDIFSNYERSHEFYLEQFSFQKIKTELDHEKIEYAKKLQSVINDAQTKLVAIPIAFLLIVSQFDLTGENLYLNLALLFSSLVFSALLDILIQNQYSSLTIISEDIGRFKKEFQEKSSVLSSEDFGETFSKIDSLQKKQRHYLNIIRGLVWLTPVFAGVLLILSLKNSSVATLLKSIMNFFD